MESDLQQIDAKEAENVREANAALAELQHLDCQWWLYSISHNTFELVVGVPFDHNNLVIYLAACSDIAGPVHWKHQRLQVIWNNNREADKSLRFKLVDESIGFKAVGMLFGWRRSYDLSTHRSLYMPRRTSPNAE